jgi:hypothetical protein
MNVSLEQSDEDLCECIAHYTSEQAAITAFEQMLPGNIAVYNAFITMSPVSMVYKFYISSFFPYTMFNEDVCTDGFNYQKSIICPEQSTLSFVDERVADGAKDINKWYIEYRAIRIALRACYETWIVFQGFKGTPFETIGKILWYNAKREYHLSNTDYYTFDKWYIQ